MAVEADILIPIFQLVAILLSAKLAGAAAGRIGQPPVLGELLAGIVIGPSLLNFVERTDLFAFLAELGAIVLLFEVGLESDLSELKLAGPPGAVVAAMGIVLPFLGGWAFAILFLADGTVALFVGASLTATSIGITARVFSDLGRLVTREAQIVLAAAIFDDVVGLILLSVLVSLAGEGVVSIPSIAITVVLALVFVLGSIVIGARSWRRLVPLVHRLRVRGVLLVFAFALALALSGVAAAIGLATIIGAFAAGLVLAETEERARITRDVKPIADVLVPVFFVIMGTLVDVRTFLDPAVLGVAAVLTGIALVTKLVAGYGLRDRRLNRLAIGVGMIPRGEVGIIFAGFGLTLGVIPPALYSSLLIMVVVTTFAAPPLLKRLMVRPPEATEPLTGGGGSRSPP
ncbi:MAG TPA: cation:proton antiporter [Thermoplasmata archaeon]|nr:cation:proton antiporter [Thermoplasmata archaeon]